MNKRTVRRLFSIAALAPIWVFVVLALASATRAADITYPQLNTQTTVQDTDLIATWRASGPLAKVQASVLNAYIQGKLNPVYAQTANNLSDLANEATARTNLGLGSAATQNTGTSGMALCLMNANCIWSGTEQFNAATTFDAAVQINSTLGVTGAVTLSGGVSGNLSVTGSPTFGTNTAAAQEVINGPAGSVRDVLFETAGVGRWLVGATSGAESGSNAGSDFVFQAISDAGGVISNPILINRASGLVTLSNGLTANGNVIFNGATPITVSTSTITANTGSCTGVTGVTGNTGAGTFSFTSSCPINGTVSITFPVSAPHGWVCVLQDAVIPAVEFRANAFSTNKCSMVVLSSATGTNDSVLFVATPF